MILAAGKHEADVTHVIKSRWLQNHKNAAQAVTPSLRGSLIEDQLQLGK